MVSYVIRNAETGTRVVLILIVMEDGLVRCIRRTYHTLV